MIRMDKFACTALCALLALTLAGCGGRASTPTQTDPGAGPAKPQAFDPTRAEVMFGAVTRSTSGVPTGVKLTWAAQTDAVSYNVYRSSATIPDTARGGTGLVVSNVPATTGTTFDDIDFGGGAAPQIGQTWFYRISAVDSDGDESRLSPQLQVDITLHFVTALDKASAAVGDTVTITGQNFGIYNAATDSVSVPGVVWDGTTTPPAFKVTNVPMPVITWTPNSIVVTTPLGWTQGAVSVKIASNTANSPAPLANTDPYITSLTPTSADVTQTVMLVGNNFGAAQDSTHFVHFGNQDVLLATNYSSYSNTQIQFKPANLRSYLSQGVLVNGGGRTSNTGFCVLTNALPTGAAVADKTLGYGTLTVNFDASTSTDPEGAPLTFDWDFNDDGSFDATGVGPTVAHTYAAVGSYSAVVRVHDADGGISALSSPIAITVNTSQQGPWYMFGHDPQHTHRSTVLANAQASAFPRRTYSSAAVNTSPTFAADGTIYDVVGTAINAYKADGTTKWKINRPAPLVASPAVGPDGTIYDGDTKGDLYAFDPVAGAVKWKYSTGGNSIQSSLAVDSNGYIYVGDDQGNLTAVRDDGPNTPFKLWKINLNALPIVSSPAVASDGTVYVGGQDGILYAVKPTGALKWSFVALVGGSITSSPAIAADGTIYVGCSASSNGLLCAITDNGASGSLKWLFGLGGANIPSSPAIMGNGHIIIGGDAGVLYLIRDDGPGARTQLAQFPPFGSPALGQFTSSPCIANDGKVYVGNDDGNVYCLSNVLASIWTYTTAAPVKSSPAIGPDGVVYVGASTGLLGLGITNPRPPTGSVSPDLSEVGQNFTVTISNGVGSPEQAKIATYDYDFGDGVVMSGVASSSQTHAYAAGGVYNVVTRAHDDNGQVSAQLKTQVKAWSRVPVVTGASAVRMAVVGGKPAIAYIVHAGATNVNSVYYIQAQDADGNNWPAAPATPIYAGSTGVDISHDTFDMKADGNGGVSIIFEETVLVVVPTLHYMHSSDGGATWPVSNTINSIAAVTGIDDAHLAFINGIPAVAFVDRVTQLCEYELATNAVGSNWNLEVPLISGGLLLPVSCDVAEINGRPAVTFCTDTQVRYLLALPNGNNGLALTDWLGNRLVQDIGTGLKQVTLEEYTDPLTSTVFPGIAALQVSTQQNVFFITGDINFATPNAPVTVVSGQLNSRIDQANINDLPSLGWGQGISLTPQDFFFDRATSYDGSSWQAPLALYAASSTGSWESLAQVDNTEGLAFLDNLSNVRFCRDPNGAPQAYFKADVITGNAPLTVNFDASASSDPEGAMADFQWDAGDGSATFDGGASGTARQVVYSAAGTYFPTLTVTDASGQTATRFIQIVVN